MFLFINSKQIEGLSINWAKTVVFTTYKIKFDEVLLLKLETVFFSVRKLRIFFTFYLHGASSARVILWRSPRSFEIGKS